MGFPIADAIIGGVNAAAGVFNTAYSVYQDQRNYDYQKALQEKQWEREDTAVQRRRADLEAAGLNPNLAAGSAASSSTVPVGSHNITPLDLGAKIGNAIDLRLAQEQLNQQKEITFQQKKISQMIKNQTTRDDVTTRWLLGYPVDNLTAYDNSYVGDMFYDPRGYSYSFRHSSVWDPESNSMVTTIPRKSNIGTSPLIQQLQYNLSGEKNSADILAKTNYWKNANELLGLINTGTGAVGNVMPRFNFNNSQSKYQGTSRNWNYNYNYRQPFGW